MVPIPAARWDSSLPRDKANHIFLDIDPEAPGFPAKTWKESYENTRKSGYHRDGTNYKGDLPV